MGRRVDQVGVRQVLINGVIAVIGVLLLAWGEWSNQFTAVTASAIVWLGRAMGIDASFVSGELRWEELSVTWTEDCSGVQSLFILFGITVWVSAHEPVGRFLTKICLVLPMALLANLFRVLFICAFRFLLYPIWEGETLHFAIGFISILPFIFIVARDYLDQAKVGVPWLVYLASILAVCSLRMDAPGGVFVLASTFTYLISLQGNDPFSRSRPLWLMIAWLDGAIAIAFLGAESLWLPWLLICPLLIEKETLTRPSTFVFLVGTVPMFAAQGMVQFVLLIAIVFRLVRKAKGQDAFTHEPAELETSGFSRIAITNFLAVAAAFFAPSCGEFVLGAQRERLAPPARIMKSSIDGGSFRVRTLGQSRDVAAFWHGGVQQGRHHSIKTCLEFRGVELDALDEIPGVLQSDRMWIRELFILEGQLYTSYFDYVTRCFPPFTSHGVHLVFQASKESVDRDHFLSETQRIAQEIYEAHRNSIRSASD